MQTAMPSAAFAAARRAYLEECVGGEAVLIKDSISGYEIHVDDAPRLGFEAHPLSSVTHPTSSMADVADLAGVLCTPIADAVAPTAICASPATGKTWMLQQCAYLVASTLRALPDSAEVPAACLIIYTKQMVRLIKGAAKGLAAHQSTETAVPLDGSFLPRLLESMYPGEAHTARRTMLLQAYADGSLVVLLDAIDEAVNEAAGLHHDVVIDYALNVLAATGVRLVLTGRKEGFKLNEAPERFTGRFVIQQLKPPSAPQVMQLCRLQLHETAGCLALFERLSEIRRLRDSLNKAFATLFDEGSIGQSHSVLAPDLFEPWGDFETEALLGATSSVEKRMTRRAACTEVKGLVLELQAQAAVLRRHFRAQMPGSGLMPAAADTECSQRLKFFSGLPAIPVLLSAFVLAVNWMKADFHRLPKNTTELYQVVFDASIDRRLSAYPWTTRVADAVRRCGAPLVGASKGGALKSKPTDLLEAHVVYKSSLACLREMSATGAVPAPAAEQDHASLVLAIAAAVARLDVHAAHDLTLRAMRKIAVSNLLAGRREFTSAHVAQCFLIEHPLDPSGLDQLAVWIRLAELDPPELGGFPLVPKLEEGTDIAAATFQFEHLSFMEGLLAQHLALLAQRRPPNGDRWEVWTTDTSAALFLNNPYMYTTCHIGGGRLGSAFARQRSAWDFSRSLTSVGLAELYLIVEQCDGLERLDLRDCGLGKEVVVNGKHVSNDADAHGLATLLLTCPSLTALDLSRNELGKLGFGLRALSVALARNASVTELALGANGFDAEGMRIICVALCKSGALKKLRVATNDGSIGAQEEGEWARGLGKAWCAAGEAKGHFVRVAGLESADA